MAVKTNAATVGPKSAVTCRARPRVVLIPREVAAIDIQIPHVIA
jgi:hypothetical protein